jgi:hypothetical protein
MNQSVIEQVRELLTDEEPAKESLVSWALALLAECGSLPHGCASSNDTGGLRVDWISPTSGVSFVVPGDNTQPYVYHESSGEYGVEPATPAALLEWLGRFKNK